MVEGVQVPNPTVTSPTEHNALLQVTAPLVDAICNSATWTVHVWHNCSTAAVKGESEEGEKVNTDSNGQQPLTAATTKTPETDGSCKGERLL